MDTSILNTEIEDHVVDLNADISVYQKVADLITHEQVCNVINFKPHTKQKEIFAFMDEHRDEITSYVLAMGRRFGKSSMTETIILREILIPHSRTVLVAPTFANAKVIFLNVYRLCLKCKIPIASKDLQRFNIVFADTNSTFSAVSETSVESVLGLRISLIIVDEAQSIPSLTTILDTYLQPTQLDYGVRSTGALYARTILLGTPRGKFHHYYDFYCKEHYDKSWKSFSAKSADNPMLPTTYLENKRLTTPEHVYKQEYEAVFLGGSESIFFSFDYDTNTYEEDEVPFVLTPHTEIISGIDIGYRDSTGKLNIVVTPEGDYYVEYEYCDNMKTTEQHVAAFRNIDAMFPQGVEVQYIDPAAAQSAADLATTYEYQTMAANNAFVEGITVLNNLFAPQGVRNRPKLFINRRCSELIRQVQQARLKNGNEGLGRNNIAKDTQKQTHFDLAIAALRYAIYTHYLSANCSDIYML